MGPKRRQRSLEASLAANGPLTQPRPAFEDQPEKGTEDSLLPFRVLLVEDNAADVMVVEEILQQQSAEFNVTVARDGQQAIELVQGLEDNPDVPVFDIALVDLNLPKRTGHEVLAELRKTKRSSDMPVIIVTSSRSANDVQRARELGATEYFEKVPDLDAYSMLGTLVMQTLRPSRPSY